MYAIIAFILTLIIVISSVKNSYKNPSSFSANAYVENGDDIELYENTDVFIREYRVKTSNN